MSFTNRSKQFQATIYCTPNVQLTEFRFYAPLDKNRSFLRRFSSQSLDMEKLNLTQQKHTFTNQNKCNTTQNKHKQELSSCQYGRPCGHNRHGPKSGGCCAPFGGWEGQLGPHLTQCCPGRGLPSYQVAS